MTCVSILLSLWQFAAALSSKWELEYQLFSANLELTAARKHLEELLSVKNIELQDTGQKLNETQSFLRIKEKELSESQIAMKVLMQNIGSSKEDLEEKAKELDEKVVLNIK